MESPSLSLRVSAPGFSCLHDPDAAVDPDAAADVLLTLPPPFWHRAGERDGVVVSELIFIHFVTLYSSFSLTLTPCSCIWWNTL